MTGLLLNVVIIGEVTESGFTDFCVFFFLCSGKMVSPIRSSGPSIAYCKDLITMMRLVKFKNSNLAPRSNQNVENQDWKTRDYEPYTTFKKI